MHTCTCVLIDGHIHEIHPFIYIYTHIQRKRESHNLVDLFPYQGLGESGVFLGCSVFFAIHDAIRAARQERGLPGPLRLNSPLTPEKIRMACEDKFTKMVRSAPTSLICFPCPCN